MYYQIMALIIKCPCISVGLNNNSHSVCKLTQDPISSGSTLKSAKPRISAHKTNNIMNFQNPMNLLNFNNLKIKIYRFSMLKGKLKVTMHKIFFVLMQKMEIPKKKVIA